MKIILANNFFSPEGGAEKIFYKRFQLLREAGHEVIPFATSRAPFFEADLDSSLFFPKYKDFEGKSNPIQKIRMLPSIFYSQTAYRSLSVLLDKINPDLIHFDNIHYHLTPATIQACVDRKIPIAMSLHDVRLMCPAGTLMYGGNVNCDIEACVGKSAMPCIKGRCYHGSFSKSLLVAAEYTFRKFHGLFEKVDMFLCPSEAMYELAIRSGISPKKLRVVPNFPLITFPKASEFSPRGQYFLYVGRLSKEKGVHVLLEACKHLPSNIPVRIVGSGEEMQKLQSTAQEFGLDNIKFEGFVDGEHLQELYLNAIATIVPSTCFEVFGLSTIESFAAGKPVIGSHTGGIPELVHPNETGFLFKSGDSEDLASQILKIHSNPALASQMGLQAQRFAAENYTEFDFLQKTLLAFDEIAECLPLLPTREVVSSY